MAQIEVTEAYPRCRQRGIAEDIPLSLDEIKDRLRRGREIGLYVDGWSEPWTCMLIGDALHARCPTAPKVTPRVVFVSRDGATYTGCDCACHHENQAG